MESSSILQGISGSIFGQSNPNSKPEAAPEVLVDSFQNALQSMSPGDIASDSVQVVKGAPEADSSNSFFDQLQQGIAGIDTDFKQTMNRVESWPSFSSYVERFDTTLEEGIKDSTSSGVKHISNVDDFSNDKLDVSTSNGVADSAAEKQSQVADRYAEMQHKTQLHYQAGAQYNTESTLWFLKAEFWMTKVKVLTSAVSSASQGVKTIFTS